MLIMKERVLMERIEVSQKNPRKLQEARLERVERQLQALEMMVALKGAVAI